MDMSIRNWYASYYVEETRKWIYGTLHLQPFSLTFVEAEQKALNQNLVINLFEVCNLRKTTSSFVFKSITITTKAGSNHWFSSFLNRECVFCAIDYFWRNALLHNQSENVCMTSSVPDSQRTKLGSSLLQRAVESECVLNAAAVRLTQQGEQIEHSIDTMQDLHTDLDVADRLVSGLEKWLGTWKLPKSYTNLDPVLVKDKDIPDVYDYDVLYTQMDSREYHQQSLRVIRISKSGVTVLDMMQKILCDITWHNISVVMVVTPWEMIVTQFQIGRPDVKFSVVSSALPFIIKKIERFARKKLEFDDNVRSRLEQNRSSLRDSRIPTQFTRIQESSSSQPSTNTKSDSSDGLDLGDQARKTCEVISDAEVSQLQTTLGNLKAIALAVREEEEVQRDKLEVLTRSVDRGNDRISATTRRTNKLL